MAELRIGLAGLGTVGRIHAAAYRDLDGARLVAVADPGPAARAGIDPGAGLATFDDVAQMLDAANLDILCIATPAATHEALVAAAAARGIQILVEKPMAPTPDAARRMVVAAEEAGVRLFYGSTYRFLPAVARAREMIASGEIGEVVLMREHAVGGKGPGTVRPMPPVHYPLGGPGGTPMGLVDHGIHLIDIFAWLSGAAVVGGHGRGNRSGGPIRTEFLHLDFDGGAMGHLLYEEGTFPTELPTEGLFSQGAGWDLDGSVAAGGWLRHPGSIHVHGTAGALRIFHYANQLFHVTGEGVRQVPLTGAPPPDHFRAQMQRLVDDIRSGRPASTPAAAGVAALDALMLAYR